MAIIPLFRKTGKRYDQREEVAIVDDVDRTTIENYRWFIGAGGYVVRYDQDRRLIKLHNVLMRPPVGYVADHINHDLLDNRRGNLRLATRSQNGKNRRKPDSFAGKQCTSKYKGVVFQPRQGRKSHWLAQIRVNGKTNCLGYHPTEVEAALAYDTAAKTSFGEFAKTNF